LTPYDILRLKEARQLSSQQFLDQYTESHIGPRSGLPIVSLSMLQEEDRRCPFVGPQGCSVYEDRPGSCRTYPLGRVTARDRNASGYQESYFLIKEPHCLGFNESTRWTVTEWKKDQGLSIYNEMNDLIMEVLSLKNRSGRGRLTPSEDDLFAMAFYDLDRFRDFAFEKRLWEACRLSDDVVEAIRVDDIALLRFAMDWIKTALFGGGPWS
jgi:hypothetical protein